MGDHNQVLGITQSLALHQRGIVGDDNVGRSSSQGLMRANTHQITMFVVKNDVHNGSFVLEKGKWPVL